MAGIDIDVEALGGIQALRESLRSAQTILMKKESSRDKKAEHIQRLDALIEQLDKYRPLDAHGKHGNLHTLFCGCDAVKSLLERTPFQN